MKLEQTQLGFSESDPVFDAVLQKYTFSINSLKEDESPEELLKNLIHITCSRAGEIDFDDIELHLPEETIKHLAIIKDKVVRYALDKLDELILKISPDEPVEEIIKFYIRDAKAMLSSLDALGLKGFLNGNECTQLEQRRKNINVKEIEFAPLSTHVEA